MLQRVMPDLMGLKSIMVLNDEAHHCYREKPGEDDVADLKGDERLEFCAVVVMACDDEIIPLQERIETVADDTDLEVVYNTERHLLYVACTRARDHLLVRVSARHRSSLMICGCETTKQVQKVHRGL
jgi:superfamily I DNA/RNA helicase